MFTSTFFGAEGIEKFTKVLFIANGVPSLVGALYTGIRMEWVLSTLGLVSYDLWNLLYLLIAIFFWLVMRRRRSISLG